MSSIEQEELVRAFFLPYTGSHMIPIMNIATLFASRGIKITIVTTSINLDFFSESVPIVNQQLDVEIDLLTMKFPNVEVGIPEGVSPLSSPDFASKFVKGLALLQHPFESLVQEFKPHCLVVDTFFHWAIKSTANKFGIPSLAFDGCGYFSHCVIPCILHHQPHKRVSSDSETFVVPGDLPHEMEFTRLQLPYYEKNNEDNTNYFIELMNQRREAHKSSYGVIFNTFYELESAYVDYFGDILGRKNWHIGPISLWFEGRRDEASLVYEKGMKCSIDLIDCMGWLDGKEPNSVIYISFGSMSHVQEDQLHELVMALESLGQSFILVVREGLVLHGFEGEVKEQGLIIKGWAPQKLILEHRAIGGFITHCGWNSVLEAVTVGLPMLTWPLHAEQFYNEKLVTEVLKIGVQIGSKKWLNRSGDECILIGKEEIINGIRRLMSGDEAQHMRNRVGELKELARKSISEGGSSYSNLNALIGELKCLRYQNANQKHKVDINGVDKKENEDVRDHLHVVSQDRTSSPEIFLLKEWSY